MQTFFLQPISGPQGPPHGPVLGPNGSRRLRRLLQTTRSVSESKDERLQSTLMALDSFLQSAPPPQSSDVTPSEDIRQPPKASEAAERSHNVPSTSQADPSPALDWRDWRSMDKKTLVDFAWTKGISWVKDQVKPTSIIEEDDYLPRAKARFAYIILLANILVYGVGLSRLITEGPEGPTNYFLSLAEVNEAVEQGEYFRIVTANFLHDSFIHLGISSYALLTIAPEAEAVLGSFAFLTTYLLAGAAGTALCFLLTDTLTVGASSGIFGLIGAMGAFLYKNHKVPKSSDGLLAAVGLLAFNLFIGHDHATTVDNVGHLGGLVCGIYLGVLLSPALLESSSSSNANPSSPTPPERSSPQSAAGNAATATTTEASFSNSDPGKSGLVRSEGVGDEGKGPSRDVKVVQPNRLQSIIVLACVTMTLASSVAATVIYRTGELPLPKWL